MGKLLNPCLNLSSVKLRSWVIVKIKQINKSKVFRTMPYTSNHSLTLAIILITHLLHHTTVLLPYPCPHHHPHPAVPPELIFYSSPHHRILSVLSNAADHFQDMFYSCVTASSSLGFFMDSFLLLTLHARHFNDHLFTYDSQRKI